MHALPSQVMNMLTGVILRGTAKVLRGSGLSKRHKTGTTTGPKRRTWFVGGTQQFVAGLYIGFDRPKNMGGYAQGGTVTAPVFKEFVTKTRDRWDDYPLVAPPGVRMVRVDRRTGKRVFDGMPGDSPDSAIIWEAFKPDSEPPRQTRRDEIAAKRAEILELIRKGRQGAGAAQQVEREEPPADFVEEQGGIY
ncbi:MAG: hypothetical protein R3E18_06245 [Sphingomonadaceae bacterium]